MQIFKIEDVKIGHWMTFISKNQEGIVERRVCCVTQIIKNSLDSYRFECSTICPLTSNVLNHRYIDDLFYSDGIDEVYESLSEIIEAYPEEFI